MPNPFPGLRPFAADEMRFFLGRETLSESVTTRVRVAPLTLMFARSGVGKSSFLNCRLMPHLRTESDVAYVNEWGSDRPERLIDAALSGLDRSPTRDERPVLVLDQFEDVFKSSASRNRLWDGIAGVANMPDTPAHILISMREEWLGAWHESEDYLPDALNCLLRLRPLSQRELLSAVTQPALREGSLRFDDDLARQLVADLKRPSAYGLEGLVVEPGLLQLVCKRLWMEARNRRMETVGRDLYEQLGGADQIIREFVWNELGSAGMKEKEIADADGAAPRFSASDRVLWSGLTRHVIAAQGVKAIVSADQLARSLLIPDMGATGRAVVEDEVPSDGERYLDLPPEKRADPPAAVVAWIGGVLEAAVEVGFMKRQRTLLADDTMMLDDAAAGGAVIAAQGDESLPPTSAASLSHRPVESRYIYELSHDALADIFQVFKIEFEGWIRAKLAKIFGIIVAAAVVLPVLLFVIATNSWQGIAGFAVLAVGISVVLALYLVVLYLVTMFLTMLGRLMMHPLYRRIMRGRVPLQRFRVRHRSR